MPATITGRASRETNAERAHRALEILASSAGDVPMERAAMAFAPNSPITADSGEAAGDVPMDRCAVTPVALGLDPELSNLLYRHRVASRLPAGSRKTATIAAVNSRFKSHVAWLASRA